MRLALPALLLCAATGCGGRGSNDAGAARDPGRALPRGIPVAILADSGSASPLRVVPPDSNRHAPPSGASAGVWMDRVTPRPASSPPALPEASPDTTLPAPEARPTPDDERLQPPIPRNVATLRVPGGRRGRVDLDVLVDVFGTVVEARWAGGDADTALVRAATECAEEMTFYPALLRDRPVEVWCRQRFEFGP